MKNGTYEDLSDKCKIIIRNYSPQESIKMISKLQCPTNGEKFGSDTAKKIYTAYSDDSVKYDSNKYRNNINSYTDTVKNNVSKSYKCG